MTALLLVTGSARKDSGVTATDHASATQATQAAGASKPTQAEPKKPATPVIEARFRPQFEAAPATPMRAVAEAPATPTAHHARRHHVDKHVVAGPKPAPPSPKKPAPDADVAQSQAVLAQSGDVTTLR